MLPDRMRRGIVPFMGKFADLKEAHDTRTASSKEHTLLGFEDMPAARALSWLDKIGKVILLTIGRHAKKFKAMIDRSHVDD